MQLILMRWILEVAVARPGVLTFGHRQVLEVNWRAGKSISEIAGVLGVSVSTVSRELGRYNSARHPFKSPAAEKNAAGAAALSELPGA